MANDETNFLNDDGNIKKYRVIDNGDGTFSSAVSIIPNDIASYSKDVWGIDKVSIDHSLLHGMFTFNIPDDTWKEEIDKVEQTSFVNATSVDGALNLKASLVLNQSVYLRTFRNLRYQPNRGNKYASSIILPNKNENSNRRFGNFTHESGEFFELDNGLLYAVVRTTIQGVTQDDRRLIDIGDINLENGNIYDIKKQWRGVGNYYFYINLKLVYTINYLGNLKRLSSFNPALPIAFECINKGDASLIICGCVDVSSEGGEEGGLSYGSIGMSNQSGEVAITGYNIPLLAIRSKSTVNQRINTRDTLALLLTAYSDQKSFLRVWTTRDSTAITLNNQSWSNYRDGHLEFITYDQPDVVTPMTFNTSKTTAIYGSRIDANTSFSTSRLFDDKTEIYMTPNDIFIFTIHRDNGGACNAGVTFEFAEAI